MCRLLAVGVVISGIALVACGGGGSSSESSEVSEQDASHLVTEKEGTEASCVRSDAGPREFTCNVDSDQGGGSTAVLTITVSEAGSSFVVESCEALGGGSSGTGPCPALTPSDQEESHEPVVVLGGEEFAGEAGEGFGTAEPSRIFNGGDPSGLVTDIHWQEWGGPIARGTGMNSIFKPEGGYYPAPVEIQLLAAELGHCEGKPAYTRLQVRVPERPGGPLGPWIDWAGNGNLCGQEGENAHAPPVMEPVIFRSPTGNIACSMSPESVRCDILKTNYVPPEGKPSDCEAQSVWGHSLLLTPDGPAELICTSDSIVDFTDESGVSILPYGREINRGPFGCFMTRRGIACASEAEHFFFLSQQKVSGG